MARDSPPCPRCRSRNTVPFRYTIPTPGPMEPLLAAVYNDAVLSGGGPMPDDAPDWFCRECGHEWSAARPLPRTA